NAASPSIAGTVMIQWQPPRKRYIKKPPEWMAINSIAMRVKRYRYMSSPSSVGENQVTRYIAASRKSGAAAASAVRENPCVCGSGQAEKSEEAEVSSGVIGGFFEACGLLLKRACTVKPETA